MIGAAAGTGMIITVYSGFLDSPSVLSRTKGWVSSIVVPLVEFFSNPEVIAASLQAIAPLLVMMYGIERYLGIFERDNVEEINRAWEYAIQEREIQPTCEHFDVLYELLSEKSGSYPDKRPDSLAFYSGGYGVSADVYCIYETDDGDVDRESFVPLVLADRWCRQETTEIHEKSRATLLFFAVVFLFVGFAIDVALITS